MISLSWVQPSSFSHFWFFFSPVFYFFIFFYFSFLGSLDRWIAERVRWNFSLVMKAVKMSRQPLTEVEIRLESTLLRVFVTRKDRALKYRIWVRQLSREKTVTIIQFKRICVFCKQASESQPESDASTHRTTTCILLMWYNQKLWIQRRVYVRPEPRRCQATYSLGNAG